MAAVVSASSPRFAARSTAERTSPVLPTLQSAASRLWATYPDARIGGANGGQVLATRGWPARDGQVRLRSARLELLSGEEVVERLFVETPCEHGHEDALCFGLQLADLRE